MNIFKTVLTAVLFCCLSSLTANAKFAPSSSFASNNSASQNSISIDDIQEKLAQVNYLLGAEDSLVVVFSTKSDSGAIYSELEAVENAIYKNKFINFDNLIHLACGGGIKECN